MIGVAISTHRRPAILAQALSGWAKYMPDVLVVVNDVNGEGVAATKNRCITALMDAGCEHLHLVDDDVWPISPDWTRYAEDPAQHLMHCWGKSRLLADDGHYTTWSWPRGVMLYTHRSVIEQVGGMRTEFGRWGGEHAEWTNRIHNCGLTTHRFTDLSAARDGIWYATDYTRSTPSSVPDSVRDDPQRTQRRHQLYDKYRDSTDYVPYR